jgi:hypothetical protein
MLSRIEISRHNDLRSANESCSQRALEIPTLTNKHYENKLKRERKLTGLEIPTEDIRLIICYSVLFAKKTTSNPT